MSNRKPDDLWYGVAVRDDSGLFLVADVCRRARGDVYVNLPRPYDPGFEPHSSVHASGQYHHKSFGRAFDVRHVQRPDRDFRGTHNIVTTTIGRGRARRLGIPCKRDDYHCVMEIRDCDLRPEETSNHLYFDIVEPGVMPTHFTGTTLQQCLATDAVPWLLLTLTEIIPTTPAGSGS